MKQIFRNIISIVAALYFLFAGTGFNLINYCCDSCESKGIEYIAEYSCSDADHNNHDSSCCDSNPNENFISDFQACKKECNIVRLNVETPTINSASKNIELIEFNIQLFTTIDLINSIANPYVFSYPEYSPPEINFLTSGREILCHNSILLI